MEVKAWSPEHHGGVEAIRKVYEDDELFLTTPAAISVAGQKLFGREKHADCARRCWSSVSATVARWSFRRCYRGTRRRLINLKRAVWAMLKNPPLQASAIGFFIG